MDGQALAHRSFSLPTLGGRRAWRHWRVYMARRSAGGHRSPGSRSTLFPVPWRRRACSQPSLPPKTFHLKLNQLGYLSWRFCSRGFSHMNGFVPPKEASGQISRCPPTQRFWCSSSGVGSWNLPFLGDWMAGGPGGALWRSITPLGHRERPVYLLRGCRTGNLHKDDIKGKMSFTFDSSGRGWW